MLVCYVMHKYILVLEANKIVAKSNDQNSKTNCTVIFIFRCIKIHNIIGTVNCHKLFEIMYVLYIKIIIKNSYAGLMFKVNDYFCS